MYQSPIPHAVNTPTLPCQDYIAHHPWSLARQYPTSVSFKFYSIAICSGPLIQRARRYTVSVARRLQSIETDAIVAQEVTVHLSHKIFAKDTILHSGEKLLSVKGRSYVSFAEKERIEPQETLEFGRGGYTIAREYVMEDAWREPFGMQ